MVWYLRCARQEGYADDTPNLQRLDLHLAKKCVPQKVTV